MRIKNTLRVLAAGATTFPMKDAMRYWVTQYPHGSINADIAVEGHR